MLVNANRKRNFHLAAYRTWKALDELREEFGEAKRLQQSRRGSGLRGGRAGFACNCLHPGCAELAGLAFSCHIGASTEPTGSIP